MSKGRKQYSGESKAKVALAVRIPSVVYSIWENTVNEYTQMHPINFIGSLGDLAAISNPAVEGGAFGGTLPRQPSNDL